MKKVATVSLGCDKNRVDTENMLYTLVKGGYEIVSDFDEAEIIIVNTCAFIEPARKESIETILGAAAYKTTGKCEKLIVSGCLPQKYLSELECDLPEVDAFIGVADYDNICDVISSVYAGERLLCINKCDSLDKENRILTTPYHYAYVKIADGCNNHCTFCTIPSIRGKYVSRSMESIKREVTDLAMQGVKEIILVAQDVTRYGEDRYGKLMLVELIKSLSMCDITWIRLMYCYPELVTDELIEEIANNPKVAKYIDIPLQHVDNGILKLMNRRSTYESTVNLINKLRAATPEIAIRTTLMVGFPSETDEQFAKLLEFVKEYKLENVGVFAYSKEPDTPSAKIKGTIPVRTKMKRVNAIGKAHLKNTMERNKSLIGKTLKVLYENIDYEKGKFVGRTQQNAPDIDTYVYFDGDYADVGNFYDVKITGYDGYDLLGRMENECN